MGVARSALLMHVALMSQASARPGNSVSAKLKSLAARATPPIILYFLSTFSLSRVWKPTLQPTTLPRQQNLSS